MVNSLSTISYHQTKVSWCEQIILLKGGCRIKVCLNMFCYYYNAWGCARVVIRGRTMESVLWEYDIKQIILELLHKKSHNDTQLIPDITSTPGVGTTPKEAC